MCSKRSERRWERPQHGNGSLAGGNQGGDAPNRRVGWGTSESVHAKSTGDAGSRFRIVRKADLECGAIDGSTRQSG